MANSNPSASIFNNAPIVDKDGKAAYAFTKAMTDFFNRINTSINQQGELISELIGAISSQAVITGRTEGIGTTVGNINSTGVITPPGLIPATDAEQGAVILPAGATGNTLGSAALSSSADFDPAGAAATAQANAEAHADVAAATAQSNAELFASDASNLNSGTVPFAQLPGISGSVTLAALTGGGMQGSITFQNGIITAVVNPT